MAGILVRGLSIKTIRRRLKARAAASGRSLQKEAKAILENSATEKTFDEPLRPGLFPPPARPISDKGRGPGQNCCRRRQVQEFSGTAK